MELLNGYIYKYEPTKIITNIYAIFFIVVAILTLIRSSIPATSVKKLLPLLLLVPLYLAILTARDQLYFSDISLFIRSIIFGMIAYLAMTTIDRSELNSFVYRFCLSWWAITTCAIFSSAAFDIGLSTYEKFGIGNKFYFQANNELAIFYSSISAYLLTVKPRLMAKLAIATISILCFLAIGTKSFIITAAIILTSSLIIKSNNRHKWNSLAITLALSPLLVLILSTQINLDKIATELIELLTAYSSGAIKISEKVNHLGTISALLGERDILISDAIETLSPKIGLIELFFGFGFTNYAQIYGNSLGQNFRFVENDVVDIFFSFGLIGITGYLLLVGHGIKRFITLQPTTNTHVTAASISYINAILLGAISGHGVFFTLPCVVLAIFAATSIKRKNYA
tara:strand:- start:13130 stop:14323 length:1194 start_codon:yes stop_codon:yes gene_type:complete